jgi:DNA-binding PadR family transcriptional regulator
MTLDRLEKKGLLSSYQTEPTAERGGRAKRCYQVTKPAMAALRESRRALLNLWEGLGAKSGI